MIIRFSVGRTVPADRGFTTDETPEDRRRNRQQPNGHWNDKTNGRLRSETNEGVRTAAGHFCLFFYSMTKICFLD